MLKKPLAHIVFLALLMNRNMLQPLLIEIWSAKFHVMLLQVQSVLVTTHMMQFYTRWLYCLDDSIEICQFGTNFMIMILIYLWCFRKESNIYFYSGYSSQFRLLLQGCVSKRCVIEAKKIIYTFTFISFRNEKDVNLKFFLSK